MNGRLFRRASSRASFSSGLKGLASAFDVTGADREVRLAPFKKFTQHLPLLYFVVLTNTYALAWTH